MPQGIVAGLAEGPAGGPANAGPTGGTMQRNRTGRGATPGPIRLAAGSALR